MPLLLVASLSFASAATAINSVDDASSVAPGLIASNGDYYLNTNLVGEAGHTGVFYIANVRNVTIDLRMYNISSPVNVAGSAAISLTNCSNVTIINGTLKGFANTGILVAWNAQNNTIKNIQMNSTAGTYGIWITNNWGAGSYGNVTNNYFENITIVRTGYGIGLEAGVSGNWFNDITTSHNSIRGLYTASSSNNVFQNIVSKNNTVWEIYTSPAGYYNTLLYNTSYGQISWHKDNLTTKGDLCLGGTYLGVDCNVTISSKGVGFNPRDMETTLNSTANITFLSSVYYNVPTVIEDAKRNCTECYISSNIPVATGAWVKFNVSHFTNYTISWLTDYTNGTRTFNTTTYETAYEGYRINYTFSDYWWPSAAMYFWYNNTISAIISPTTAGDVHTYENPFDTMNVNYPTNVSFIWELRLNATKVVNSTNASVLIRPTYLAPAASQYGIENATQKYCVLNITFLDETTSANMNVTVSPLDVIYYLGHGSTTKTMTYINSTNVSYVAFCFNASLDSYQPTGQISVRYKQDPLYTERFSTITRNLNTTSPELSLLLLSIAAGGSEVSFSVQTQGGTPISSAYVVVERLIGSSWITIGSDTTGDDGVVTFTLNTLYNHRFTFTKTGYLTKSVTIRPTQSFYTVYMDTNVVVVANQTITDLSYTRSPTETTLKQNNYYNFTYTVYPSNSTGLQAYRLSLLFANGTTWNATYYGQTNSTGVTGLRVYMDNVSNWVIARYYVNTTNYTQWYQLGATRYSVYNFSTGRGSLWQAILNIDEYKSEDANTQFTTAFFSLLILLVILASFNYVMGFELSNPGQALVLVTIIIGMLSVGGLLTVSLPGGNIFFEKYMLLIITLLFAGGYWISRLRDTG